MPRFRWRENNAGWHDLSAEWHGLDARFWDWVTPFLRQVLRALTCYLIKEDLYSPRLKFNSWISIQLYKVYNMLKVFCTWQGPFKKYISGHCPKDFWSHSMSLFVNIKIETFSTFSLTIVDKFLYAQFRMTT